MSRVDAVNVAVMKAQEPVESSSLAGSVAASDAFFPFRDGLDARGGGRRDRRRAARRIGARRGGDRRGRRARPGDGVHREAAFPALTVLGVLEALEVLEVLEVLKVLEAPATAPPRRLDASSPSGSCRIAPEVGR